MHNIIIMASGAGTNANAIINHFRNHKTVHIALIVCNKPQAGVLAIAQREEIPFLLVTLQTFQQTLLLEQLANYQPSLIILAGFIWKIPSSILNAFPNKIINIHPSLLPKFGGKGMFGINVHKNVVLSREENSGITIHFVNEAYDEGQIILQAVCTINSDRNAEILASQIHELEYFYYPRVIEFLLANKQ